MSSSDPGGYGFFGKGYWGRRIFWGNVPTQQKALDVDGWMEGFLKVLGDEGESFLNQIAALPSQRDPYQVIAEEGVEEWFYFTSALSYEDDYWGKVVRLVGEPDYTQMPETDEEDPPSATQSVLDEWYPWFPYAPISSIARWWWCRWHGVTDDGVAGEDARYEVVKVRTRNFDWPGQYISGSSLGNEVWIKSDDLYIPFEWEDVVIGEGDNSQEPSVVLPFKPLRLAYNDTDSPTPWLVANAKVNINVSISSSIVPLYDVPNVPWDGSGNMYPASGTDIVTATSYGTVNYETGEIVMALPTNADADVDITSKFTVRGYYLSMQRPRIIDHLARDFGFENDRNDPEDVQRSTIANISKYFGLKASQDSYRIRGEISLFDVFVRSLWRICDSSFWASIPVQNAFMYHGTMYTDIEPKYLRFDDIAADEELYDPDTSSWVTLVDNAIVHLDDSTDGYSVGLAYALDVAQGYYANVADTPHPLSAIPRDPAGAVSVTALTNEQLLSYGLQAGYFVEIRMMRCQAENWSWVKGKFGITEYQKAASVPPAYGDDIFWIDSVLSAWSDPTSPATPSDDDVGSMTVVIGVGTDSSGVAVDGPVVGHADIVSVVAASATVKISGDHTATVSAGDSIGIIRSTANDTDYTVISATLNGVNTDLVVSPGPAADSGADGEVHWTDIAIRYVPELDLENCCFCLSYKRRVEITPTAEAYEHYGSGVSMDAAVGRLRRKIVATLAPIHTRVVDWAVSKEWTLENVDTGATIEETLASEFLSDDLSGVTAASTVTNTFTITGDRTKDLAAGETITIVDSTANDGDYVIDTVVLNANEEDTDVGVTTAVPSAVGDGSLRPMPTKILMKVEQRGDMSLSQTQTFNLYDESASVVWTSTDTTGVSDATTWYTVTENEDVTSDIGNNANVKIEAIAAAGITYGDVRFTFTVSRYQR